MPNIISLPHFIALSHVHSAHIYAMNGNRNFTGIRLIKEEDHALEFHELGEIMLVARDINA